MRLDKYLSDEGLGTRTEVKTIIKAGKVKINDEVIKKADYKVKDDDMVFVDNKEVVHQSNHYYMLNKPAGVITANEDKTEKTVMDLLPKELTKNLFAVGRLDKDTEGLLLLTDDGPLSHNLLSPKKHVEKTYYLVADGKIDEDKVNKLENGIDIGEEKLTLPARVENIKKIKENSYSLELTITEGKFHQVKRMIAAIEGEVTYLKRLSMGSLILDENLKKGEYRELSIEEVDLLKNRG